MVLRTAWEVHVVVVVVGGRDVDGLMDTRTYALMDYFESNT